MNVVVCVKQIPDPAEPGKLEADNTLDRSGKLILHYRFFEGLTQSEIASRLGISQMHVSRLLARSLAELRAAADEE